MKGKIFNVVVVCLLVLFAAQGAFLIVRMSPTVDEVNFHMVNGYAYLNTRDYRMSPANPALTREWMALPWFYWKPRLDLDKDSWRAVDSVPFAADFFYNDNRALADHLLYSSRAMILGLGLVLGWLIHSWSRALYGPWGGLTSLSLYVFSPSFIAHSSIAHTDLAVSLFVFGSGYALWRYLETGRARERFIFCAIFGLAAACKYHALFFGPVYLAILFFKRGWRDAAKTAALLGVVSLGVIWASYGFDFKPILSNGVPRIQEKLAMIPAFTRKFALEVPVPAPSYWLGLAGILRSHQEPYRYFAFGEWTTRPHPVSEAGPRARSGHRTPARTVRGPALDEVGDGG